MDQLLIALDVDDGTRALRLVDSLRGVAGGFKVGSQLFLAEGPEIVEAITARGERVFLDLKLHDIPNTVAHAVEAAVGMGAWMLTVHTLGGADMMRAAADAATRAAARTGRARPLVVGVTVLTSHRPESLSELGVTRSLPDQVTSLALMASQAGLDGVVCSPLEATGLRGTCGRDFTLVTPGIRPRRPEAKTGRTTSTPPITSMTGPDDQRRTLGPAEALRAGADYLVVGRPVIGAPDPCTAAREIITDLQSALTQDPAGRPPSPGS